MIKYILLILIFVSCSLEFSDDKESWDKGTINNENAISISHDGLNREYVLHVPDSYNGGDSVPLVFNLHGGSGTATGQRYFSCLLYTSPSPRDAHESRMPSSA